MTVRSKVSFAVKQYPSGNLFIVFAPVSHGLNGEGLPERGLWGFDLPEGTSGPQADEIARFLDENITAFTFTRY
jgi:hypothetical protein